MTSALAEVVITDGMWVAIITVAGTIVVALIGIVVALINRKSEAKNPPVFDAPAPTPAISPTALPTANLEPLGLSELIVKPPVQEIKVSDIKHATIMAAINAAPPYDQDSVEEHYVGLKVSWRAVLGSISRSRHSGDVNVFAELAEGYYCHLECESSKEGTASLATTPQGAEIMIIGVLRAVSTAYCHLDQCTIYSIAQTASRALPKPTGP